jgi:hypothetical protein
MKRLAITGAGICVLALVATVAVRDAARVLLSGDAEAAI